MIKRLTMRKVLGMRAKLGNVVYEATEAGMRRPDGRTYEQVWPLIYTAIIEESTLRIAYSEGTMFRADGGNYAQLFATVNIYYDGDIVDSYEDVELTAIPFSYWPWTPYIDNMGNIRAPSRGETLGEQQTLFAVMTVAYESPYGRATSQLDCWFTQEANRQESADTYEYSLECEIQHSSALPATGGSYIVNYISQRVSVHHYTAGDFPGTPTDVTSSITTRFCSARKGTDPVTSVSGIGWFYVDVPANGGGSRFVSCTMQYDVMHTAGWTKVQNAMAAVEATFTPDYGRRTGYLYVDMALTKGTPLGDTVLTNVVLRFTRSGGSWQAAALDDVTITDGGHVQLMSAGRAIRFMPGSYGQMRLEAIVNNITTPTFPTIDYEIMAPEPEREAAEN